MSICESVCPYALLPKAGIVVVTTIRFDIAPLEDKIAAGAIVSPRPGRLNREAGLFLVSKLTQVNLLWAWIVNHGSYDLCGYYLVSPMRSAKSAALR